MGRRIKIKTERSVCQNLGIKTEKRASQNHQQTKSSTKTDGSTSFVQEKGKLLDTLTNLKSENQKLTFDLKKKSDEVNTLKRENENLVQKALFMTTKANDLKSDLSQAQSKLVQKNAEHKNQIANLTHQNKLLSAQLNQLKTSAADANDHDANNSHNNEYEVERLLDDEMDGNVRYYLVRWKGYPSKHHDTWERESNLECPEILKQYEAKKMKML